MLNLSKPFFVLAPMDDVTDTVFRQIIADTAPPDLYFTEFVNVDGLQSPGRDKLMKKLQFTDKEKPLIAQIWGKNPDNYRKTARELVKMGYAGIDINMGCPDKTVVKNGCCSALIHNRELAGAIIEAVREGVGNNHFPISVKTRVGFHNVDESWIEFLLSYKLNMLSIHLRTVKEMSAVPARYELLAKIKTMRDSLSPTTLLVANGDIRDRQHGLELARTYGVDGLMIGRGIFQDPYAFAEQSPWETMAKEDRMALYRKHVELFAKTWTNNERRIHTLNKFCKIYINHFDGAKEMREVLMACQSTPELLGHLA